MEYWSKMTFKKIPLMFFITVASEGDSVPLAKGYKSASSKDLFL
jgi:hypothetical protein